MLYCQFLDFQCFFRFIVASTSYGTSSNSSCLKVVVIFVLVFLSLSLRLFNLDVVYVDHYSSCMSDLFIKTSPTHTPFTAHQSCRFLLMLHHLIHLHGFSFSVITLLDNYSVNFYNIQVQWIVLFEFICM